MRKKCVQLSLFNTYTDVLESMENNKPDIIDLIEEYIDFEAIISPRFYFAYYRHYGRKRINPLESFIRILFLQKLFRIKETKFLLTILHHSKELRDFCGFNKVPTASQVSDFKSDFCEYIKEMFENLVDITAPIRKEIDEKKSQYLIFDTTGIEPYVKENNPKFYNTKLNLAKKFKNQIPTMTLTKLFTVCSPMKPKALPEQNINT